jgi:DnaJ-class molecular chaperone
VQSPEACPTCGGTGLSGTCTACGGKRVVRLGEPRKTSVDLIGVAGEKGK